MLYEIIKKYNNLNIDIAFTGMKGPVRDVFEKSEIMKEISYKNCFMSIQEAVDSFDKNANNKENIRNFNRYVEQTNR